MHTEGNQTPYSKLLDEIANAELSQENYEALHNRRESIIPKNELDMFENAIHLYPKCIQVDAHNEKHLKNTGKQ